MEIGLISAIVTPISTLVGVYVGHKLAMSRRREKYADFLYQERFKTYMSFMTILDELTEQYYTTKWDIEGIEKLYRLWDRTYDYLGTKLIVFKPEIAVAIGNMLDDLNPKIIATTRKFDFAKTKFEIYNKLSNDLEIPYFNKQISTTMGKFLGKHTKDRLIKIVD